MTLTSVPKRGFDSSDEFNREERLWHDFVPDTRVETIPCEDKRLRATRSGGVRDICAGTVR
jgi:hypothetical protein